MTDEQRRYKLYRFLLFYYGNAGNNTVSYYMMQNFWAEFCKDSSLLLTDANVSSFMNKFFVFLNGVNQSTDNAKHKIHYQLQNATLSLLLNNAFGEIGVSVSIVSDGSYYCAIFTMPNGEKKGIQTLSPVVTKEIIRQEIEYAKSAYNTMLINNTVLDNISNVKNYNGNNTYWEYNSAKNRVEISGTGKTLGAYIIAPSNNDVNPVSPEVSTTFDTIMFNRGVSEISGSSLTCGDELTTAKRIKVVVFKHQPSDTLILDSGWIPSPKSASSPKQTYDIYADHPAVSSYSYSSNITVNIHPLSEWED